MSDWKRRIAIFLCMVMTLDHGLMYDTTAGSTGGIKPDEIYLVDRNKLEL